MEAVPVGGREQGRSFESVGLVSGGVVVAEKEHRLLAQSGQGAENNPEATAFRALPRGQSMEAQWDGAGVCEEGRSVSGESVSLSWSGGLGIGDWD